MFIRDILLILLSCLLGVIMALIHVDMLDKENKNFAIEEFEKVKTELEKTYPMNGYGIPSSRATGKSVGYGIHIALEIIDKHISELKGETHVEN